MRPSVYCSRLLHCKHAVPHSCCLPRARRRLLPRDAPPAAACVVLCLMIMSRQDLHERATGAWLRSNARRRGCALWTTLAGLGGGKNQGPCKERQGGWSWDQGGRRKGICTRRCSQIKRMQVEVGVRVAAQARHLTRPWLPLCCCACWDRELPLELPRAGKPGQMEAASMWSRRPMSRSARCARSALTCGGSMRRRRRRQSP